MNRRSFMKAAGIAIAGIGLIGSAQAKEATLIPEHCEGAYIPEWHQHECYVSDTIILANPAQMSMNWVGKVNQFPTTLLVKNKGFVEFPPCTLLFDGVSGSRDDMNRPFVCRLTFTHRLTGGFNDVLEMYNRASLQGLLSRCEWSEIKENV